MQESRFRQHMRAFDHWRAGLIGTIEQFQGWLDEHGLGTGETDLRIFEALETLRSDTLTVAFVAEFSRGKTELINAVFFADYGRRLLPSEAGRTTMCPTELFYDREAEEAYIRLLPIETRLEEVSIAEYKRDPINWTTIPLQTDSPNQMAEALKEVVKVKQVKVEEAERLGLYQEQENEPRPRHVEVPMWRHALISFPHPLLKEGLVILDTPGVNALGSEPELTVSMLPGAHAVLFLLAADTGVTRSDMDLWQHHIKGMQRQRERGLMAVLNKIDILWDELRDGESIDSSIRSQLDATGNALGIEPNQVFAVSAQKGLLAKVRDDREMLERSRLARLEEYLSNEILPAKQQIIRENIVREIGGILDNSRRTLEGKLESAQKQLDELKALSGKNADVIVHLMRKSREEQATYLKNVESFQSSRRLMMQQAKAMQDALSMEAFDRLVTETRKAMVESWTTSGLKSGMKRFFEGARSTMEQVQAQADQTRRLAQAIYRKFHQDHGLTELSPKALDMDKYQKELNALHEEAEAFRNSPVTTMTEQSFVVKKFFVSMVSHARNIFYRANQESETWLKEVLNPLASQIKAHKHQMEKRLETLRKINQSRETLDHKVSELEQQVEALSQDLARLDELRQPLEHPVPFEVVTTVEAADDNQSRAAL